MIGALPPQIVDRFRADLESLTGALSHEDRIAIAVSGGPDSLALLLLAHAAFPDKVRAATVDHGLRPAGAGEARFVANISTQLGLPHSTLTAEWPDGPPLAAIQENAREARYAALLKWCTATNATMLLTAHHADDQAETLLMRLGRGAGLAGLAGIRPVRGGGCHIVRPLLGWRADDLAQLCRKAGLVPIDDPSNADPRHERSRVRKLLRASNALDSVKLAQSADHLFEAEEAMRWIAGEVVRSRAEIGANRISFDAGGLPREIRRRALALLLERFGAEPRGSALDRVMIQLENGRAATLSGLRLRPGTRWTVTRAPPRRAK
jgi:tRNA(Ile)-lysidine synthase